MTPMTWSKGSNLPSWATTRTQRGLLPKRLLSISTLGLFTAILALFYLYSNTFYSTLVSTTSSSSSSLDYSPIKLTPSYGRVHPNARDVRIHFANHHFGTSSELKAVAKALSDKNGVKVTVKESWGIYELVRSLYVPKKQSNDYWPIAKQVECNADKYDIIVVGDTMSLVRPHLQNCCPLRLVVSLTTRYDWAHDQDLEWKYLVGNASQYWNNFRIYPNNLIEEWYARYKGADIAMSNYLPSSGLPSQLWTEALKTVDFKTSQPDDHQLIVPASVRTEQCLTSQLRKWNIAYTTYERNKYGGPLGLTDRIVVHFPYQSNTMSLFENLHQRVIYVLPTLRLFREMGSSCLASLEKIPSSLLTDEDFETHVDWWRRDLQPLFFYFDNYTDLQEGSELRKTIALEADAKRVQIGQFMIKQRNYVLEQWEDILFTDWHGDGRVNPSCQRYNLLNP